VDAIICIICGGGAALSLILLNKESFTSFKMHKTKEDMYAAVGKLYDKLFTKFGILYFLLGFMCFFVFGTAFLKKNALEASVFYLLGGFLVILIVILIEQMKKIKPKKI